MGPCSLALKRCFPLARVIHLARFKSDHATICIMIQKECPREKRFRLFKFEEACSKDDRCESLVRQLWNGAAPLIQQMLKSVQVLLHSFKDLRTGEVAKEMKRIESLLKDDRRWSTNVEEINQFKALEKQRDKLLRIEETI